MDSRGDAVRGCDDPPVTDQRAAARQLLAEEPRLDQRRLPRVRAEAGGVASHDAVRPGVVLAATWNRGWEGLKK